MLTPPHLNMASPFPLVVLRSRTRSKHTSGDNGVWTLRPCLTRLLISCSCPCGFMTSFSTGFGGAFNFISLGPMLGILNVGTEGSSLCTLNPFSWLSCFSSPEKKMSGSNLSNAFCRRTIFTYEKN